MPVGIYKRTANMKTGKYKHYPHQGFQKRNKIGNRFKKGHQSVFKGKKRPNMSGVNNYAWKGGEYKSNNGYFYILTPNHPRANCRRYVKRANLVMEKIIGRFLKPKEIVHHKNRIKVDDRPENLQLFANDIKHHKFHNLNKNY